MHLCNEVKLTHEEETEGRTSIASSLQEDLGEWLASSACQDSLEIAQRKHDDDKEDESEGTAVLVSTAHCA